MILSWKATYSCLSLGQMTLTYGMSGLGPTSKLIIAVYGLTDLAQSRFIEYQAVAGMFWPGQIKLCTYYSVVPTERPGQVSRISPSQQSYSWSCHLVGRKDNDGAHEERSGRVSQYIRGSDESRQPKQASMRSGVIGAKTHLNASNTEYVAR